MRALHCLGCLAAGKSAAARANLWKSSKWLEDFLQTLPSIFRLKMGLDMLAEVMEHVKNFSPHDVANATEVFQGLLGQESALLIET